MAHSALMGGAHTPTHAHVQAVVDPFIWAPNAVGAFFGVLQLVLLGVFPSKPSAGAKRAAAAAAVQDDALSAPLTADGAAAANGDGI